jgi:hypothetical protein
MSVFRHDPMCIGSLTRCTQAEYMCAFPFLVFSFSLNYFPSFCMYVYPLEATEWIAIFLISSICQSAHRLHKIDPSSISALIEKKKKKTQTVFEKSHFSDVPNVLIRTLKPITLYGRICAEHDALSHNKI